MIVNRMDCLPVEGGAIGVGIEILETGGYAKDEGDLLLGILNLRRQYYGDGVLAIDGGANIGVFTVDWAKQMSEWGRVIAFEAQERVFYALAGNVTLNNCFNAALIHAAVSDQDGSMQMPVPDYSIPSNFGGLSLNGSNENIGQEIKDTATVRMLKIDSLKLERCDLIKLDIEGMELEALKGAEQTIDDYHPVLAIEHINTGVDPLVEWLEPKGYTAFPFGMNLVFVHRLDKVLDHMTHTLKTLVREELARGEAA
jgi:FkbM family methyltransferase